MLITGLVFFVILSILVLIHELGHFLVARWFGVGVEEFGLGLPPRIWGKKIKGTIYSLNYLPIGGFVKLAGEDDEEQVPKYKIQNTKYYFWAKSKKQRALILLAGVSMNFLLAWGITSYLLTQGIFEPTGQVKIEKIIAGSPAAKAGLMAGDVIAEVSFQKEQAIPVSIPKDLIEFTNQHRGQPINLTISRDSQILQLAIIPRKDYPSGQGPLGVQITDLAKVKYTLPQAPLKGLEINLLRARDMLAVIGQVLWRMVTLQRLGADVAGPIGIAQATGAAVKFGFTAVLEFMSILSLNLAVLNILPIPALDGGRLLFVFLEKVLRRRIKPAFEKQTHQIGMIILFTLILLVSLNDILRLVKGG